MNRKFLNLTFIFTFIASSLCAQEYTYTLDGTVDANNNGRSVYLKTLNDSKTEIVILDSTTINNGAFSFTETFEKPKQIRFVQIDDISNTPLLFIPEHGRINLKLFNGSNSVSGTPENDRLQDLLSTEIELSNKGNQIASNYQGKTDTPESNELYLKESGILLNKIKTNRYNYITQNIDSDLGEFMLLSSLELLPADTILQLLSKTRSDFQNSKTGKDLVEYYEPQLAKTVGSQFKDLKLMDTDGKEVKLSDLVGKGKVVLLDFWASWCPPCIKEMPSLVELYQQYKDKGLEIVGVSLDDQKDSWINAINRHKMSWVQMSDLKGWESAAVKSYGVYSIPLTILIDQEGTVVGSNLSSAELKIKLNQLLK